MFFIPKKKIALDLGSSNSLLYLEKKGIIINQPSLVSLSKKTGQIIAFGKKAEEMLERVPSHISVIRPIEGGVISDFEVIGQMLKYFFSKIEESSFFSPYLEAAINIPCNVTEVERKAVEDAAKDAGVNKVYLIESPLSIALGSRLPIREAKGNLIIDIGGGTTEISVISLGGIVRANNLKIAGDKFDEAIIDYLSQNYKLLIGKPTAKNLKETIGSAINNFTNLPESVFVKGRDILTGMPKEIEIVPNDIFQAISPLLSQLVENIKIVIEETPPELIADIMKNGIYLSGGGSLLKNIDRMIEKEIGIKTIIVNDPLNAVVRGNGFLIENINKVKDLGINLA